MDKNLIHKNSKDEGYTPEGVFKMFGPFYLDVCTTFDLIEEHIRNDYIEMGYTKNHDGLDKHGYGKVGLNPPFSNKKEGIIKARKEMERDKEVDVGMLLPLSMNSKIGHSHILGRAEIFIPNSRIKFIDPLKLGKKSTTPNFDSCIVHLTREPNNTYKMIEVGEQ